MRRHHYSVRRIILHIFKPLIENSVFINGFQRAKLLRLIGYKNIDREVFIGRGVFLDEMNPLGIHIKTGCTITRGSTFLTHFYNTKDFTWMAGDIFIGENVYVGCNAIICKPITIGDNTLIAAGAVVVKNCESNSIYGGVPAKKIGTHMNNKPLC